MMPLFKVIDNVVSKDYQDYLENILLKNPTMDWHLTRSLDNGKSKQDDIGTVGFSVLAIEANNELGGLGHVFRGLGYTLAEKFNVPLNQILAARTFLQTPTLLTAETRLYHVDLNRNHNVMLYYVNDSDGNTIILKEKFPFNHNKQTGLPGGEIIQEITPKKGRAVLFDGLHFHASSVPSKDLRCVINFDII